MIKALAYAKKLLVYVGGVAAYAVTSGIFSGRAQDIAVAVVAILTAAGIYVAKNAPKPPANI